MSSYYYICVLIRLYMVPGRRGLPPRARHPARPPRRLSPSPPACPRSQRPEHGVGIQKKNEVKQKSLLYLLRPHASIHVSSYYYTTTIYLARSYYYMCPHTAVCINAGCAVSGGCGAHSAHESEQDRRGYALAPWPQVLNTTSYYTHTTHTAHTRHTMHLAASHY